MTQKKMKFDMNSPQAQALMDEIGHGTFVKEGTMVAFPTCFPGASVPIPADESRITALDTTAEGHVYGGTSGRRSHIFVGMFHGVTGMIFDLNAVEGATHCAAVCCGKKQFLACVNGPTGGGRILAAKLQPLPYDLVQEWGFERPEFQDLGTVVESEPIVHAVADAARDSVVGVTSRHLFTVDLQASKVQVVAEVPGSGRIAQTPGGNIVGCDGGGYLWRYDMGAQAIHRKAFQLPQGRWDKCSLTWSRARKGEPLFIADGEGRLFSFDERKGFSAPLGKTMLSPVGPMAVTLDGRLFGFCGAGIAKMFCYGPGPGEVTNLGVALSVIERRRYGYVFGDAVTGRDGEVYFGEDDNLGHLWIYFPRIRAQQN